MNVQKRYGVAVGLLAAGALVLSACSGGGAGGDKAAGDAGKQASSNLPAGFNETGYPIVKDKITLKFAAAKGSVSKDFDGLPFFQQYEDETNVHIEWSLNPDTNWNEKKNLIFASGDLPDAFYGHHILTPEEVLKYGTQGLLIPLEDLIEKYAPNLKKVFEANPSFKQEMTAPDGHIYALPTIDEGYPDSRDALFINRKWLEKLGLQPPKTTEEFYNVLKAFKENDMNGNGKADEIPFSFQDHPNYGIYSFFGAFGLPDRQNHINLENGKVQFSAVQPSYRKAIEYLHKLYAEGLIDVEALTHDKNVYFSKIKASQVGVFIGWDHYDVFGTTPNDYDVLLPLKGPDGFQLWNRYPVGLLSKGAFAITSVNEYPEVTMRWIDRSYDPMIGLQAVEGPFGINLNLRPDGKIESIPGPNGMNENEFRHSTAPASKSVFIRTKELNEKRVRQTVEGSLSKSEIDAMYKPYLVKDIYPELFYTEEENEERLRYFTDIDAYVKKMRAQWIYKGNIENEWDEYINTLNRMGLDKMVAVYQSAYDRFMKK